LSEEGENGGAVRASSDEEWKGRCRRREVRRGDAGAKRIALDEGQDGGEAGRRVVRAGGGQEGVNDREGVRAVVWL